MSMDASDMMLYQFEWASPEDRQKAASDMELYGNCFVRRDDDGLMRRCDPTTVTNVRREEVT